MEYLAGALCLAVAALLYTLYHFGTKNRDYWAKRGVVGPKPIPFLGSMKEYLLVTEPAADVMSRHYRAYTGHPYIGLLMAWRPTLIVRDLELAKRILSVDFEYFPDRSLLPSEKDDPLSANLVTLDGLRWKGLRGKLSPAFSTGKVKRMFPLMAEISVELQAVLRTACDSGEPLLIGDLLSRYTTDVVTSCAFGVRCDALSYSDSEVYRQGLNILAPSWRNMVRFAFLSAFPNVSLLHKLARDKAVMDFFKSILKEAETQRENNHVKRNDLVDCLLQVKNMGKIVEGNGDVSEDPFLKAPVPTSSEELKFTDDIMTAQAMAFFAAGTDTSSSLMTFCLAELAFHPDIQDRVQAELDAALGADLAHGGITYEALAQCAYLDKVMSESLRKHCPAPYLDRTVLLPYRVPGSDLVLEPGTAVFIPIAAIHNDPAHFPEPERFDPERFAPEAVVARHPFAFLPFGGGPRICIGARFGLLQAKLGLAAVLSRFRVKPSPASRYPIEYAPGTIVTGCKDGCPVLLQPRAAPQL